jgi:hypothetical protein
MSVTYEELQNVGLFSAFRSFEQEGIFKKSIMLHLLWHGTLVPRDRSVKVFFMKSKKYWGPILTRI